MDNLVIEQKYPLSFRQQDSKRLGEYIRSRQSVVLIGMRRVGISNFLRFFLNHPQVIDQYVDPERGHLFVPVDLNSLVERELYPFWMLTFKRIIDSVETSNLPAKTKQDIESLFLSSIQSKELFLLLENIRKTLTFIIAKGATPTIFFLRFDRISDAINPEFFNNIQGLQDSTHGILSFVFTSFRSLDHLAPKVFTKASLSTFAKNMYITPASSKDAQIIYQTYKDYYKLELETKLEHQLFLLVDGYTQYLQLALIHLSEIRRDLPKSSQLFKSLISDERIHLQSEELWESLEEAEKRLLLKILRHSKFTASDRQKNSYLWQTGMVVDIKNKPQIFSSLFSYYLEQKNDHQQKGDEYELTKKEFQLFKFLKENINQVCERESIIEAVWPEEEELGVSDWAVDRLVGRLRAKLKSQNQPLEIVTIKTRGYKLADKPSMLNKLISR